MFDVSLSVGGFAYGGWKTVTVTRSIERLAGTFNLGVSERWPGQQALRGILPGQACTVAIDGETVITGYVDTVSPSYSATSHDVDVTGRDTTGDLVDCSAVHTPGEWTDRKLEAIAAELARPFGISVRTQTDTGEPFLRFRIEEGETAFEAIDRACRMRAVLATSDSRGGMVITRAGESRASTRLVRGQNILEAGGEFSHLDRFASYTVKGQRPGADFLPSEMIAQLRGTASDPGIKRYRPLVILAEHASDPTIAQDRATWEANVRAARARKVSVTVQGWRERDGGALWAPNRLVGLTDDWLNVDQEMLISGVSFTKDDKGTRAVLSLVPPGAFQLIAVPETKTGWML